MTYSFKFDACALKEWPKLAAIYVSNSRRSSLRFWSTRALKRIDCMPYLTATRSSCAAAATDWVYQVIDQEVVAFVVAVDKREWQQVYVKAAERLRS